MTFDSDFREANIAALGTATPLTAQGADTPGAFVVPTNVSRITEIRIGVGLSIADDAIMGLTTGIHIYGGGVTLAEGWFPGPVCTTGSIAAASGDRIGDVTQKYLTNIPVKPGGQFNIDGYMLGEDVGAIQMLVQIIYDGPVAGKIRDMDFRTMDLTAANTLVTLTERNDAVVEGDIRPAYPTIGEIFVGAGAKITVSAGVVVGLAFQLSGPGLLSAGNYKFISGHTWGLSTESAANTKISQLERYVCGIQTKLGNAIRIQAQMIEGDVGTAFSIVGFAYY
jgi:hypothetical protein